MNKAFVFLCVGTLFLVQLCSADDVYLGLPCNQCINVDGDGSNAAYFQVNCGDRNATLMVQCTDSACKSCTSLPINYGATLHAGSTTLSIGSPFSCQLVTGKQFANANCTGTGVSKLAGITGYCSPSDNTTIVCSQGTAAEKTCDLKTTIVGPFTPTSCFNGGNKYMEVACGATTKCVAIHSVTASTTHSPPTVHSPAPSSMPSSNAYSCGKCQPNQNTNDGTFATASCGTTSATLKYECNKGCSKCARSFTAAYNKASISHPTVSSPFACSPVSMSLFSSSKCTPKSQTGSTVQFTGWCSSPQDNLQFTCTPSGFALQTCDKKPKTQLGPFAAGKCFNTHNNEGNYAEATCAAPTTCIIVTG